MPKRKLIKDQKRFLDEFGNLDPNSITGGNPKDSCDSTCKTSIESPDRTVVETEITSPDNLLDKLPHNHADEESKKNESAKSSDEHKKEEPSDIHPEGTKKTPQPPPPVEPSDNKDGSTVSVSDTAKRDVAFIEGKVAQENEKLKQEIIKHESILKEKDDIINTLNKKVSELERYSLNKENLNNRAYGYFDVVKDLSDYLNSNGECITVQVNKELLSKATKFVDTNSLVRLESIIRHNKDISSSIVQSILLAFIYQNSLE